MNGSPPRMPKKLLPMLLGFADEPVQRLGRSMHLARASTSTQQPWQRRLQLLMIET